MQKWNQIPCGPACDTGKHGHANKVHLNELCNCYNLCCISLAQIDPLQGI